MLMNYITLDATSSVQERNIALKANKLRAQFTFVFTKFRVASKLQADFVFIQVLIQVSS